MLTEDGIMLRKYWFSVSDEEQEARFRSPRGPDAAVETVADGSAVDHTLGGLLRAKDDMFVHTDVAPTCGTSWRATTNGARINRIDHLLSTILTRWRRRRWIFPTGPNHRLPAPTEGQFQAYVPDHAADVELAPAPRSGHQREGSTDQQPRVEECSEPQPQRASVTGGASIRRHAPLRTRVPLPRPATTSGLNNRGPSPAGLSSGRRPRIEAPPPSCGINQGPSIRSRAYQDTEPACPGRHRSGRCCTSQMISVRLGTTWSPCVSYSQGIHQRRGQPVRAGVMVAIGGAAAVPRRDRSCVCVSTGSDPDSYYRAVVTAVNDFHRGWEDPGIAF